MITFNFDKSLKPCGSCKGLYPDSDTGFYCILGYSTFFHGTYFPVYPCNRPITSDDLLELLNNLFFKDQ